MHKNIRTWLGSTFIVLALMLCACNPKASNAPISKDKMAMVLLDLHLAEGQSLIQYSDSTQHKSKTTGKNLDSLAMYYHSILEHHHISLQQWEEALHWYKDHSDSLEKVYDMILPKLEPLKAPYTNSNSR